jgi:hypothetical protein
VSARQVALCGGMTRDFQVFELDVAWRPPLWVLDVIQD